MHFTSELVRRRYTVLFSFILLLGVLSTSTPAMDNVLISCVNTSRAAALIKDWDLHLERAIRESGYSSDFRDSMFSALKKWKADGEVPLIQRPVALYGTPSRNLAERTDGLKREEEEFGNPWVSNILTDPQIHFFDSLQSETPPQVLKSHAGRRVIRIQLHGQPWILRPFETRNPTAAVRKNFMAGYVASMMQVSFAPDGTLARLPSNIILLTKYVEGTQGNLEPAYLDPWAWADVTAGAFLVGEVDPNPYNVIVEDNSYPTQVDFGDAFYPGLLPKNDFALFGPAEPAGYTKRFEAGLRRINPEVFSGATSGFLSERERNWLLFRRLVLLEDMRRQPDKFILGP